MKDPPYRIKNMMPGMIMLWYGSVATIPSGWHLCDGTMGTPNLVGAFVAGAKEAPYAPGSTGGLINHSHPFIGNGHLHSLSAGDSIEVNPPVGVYSASTNSVQSAGVTDSVDGRPPYHCLCYIMKL